MKKYKTVKTGIQTLTIIEKSKFIAYCYPVGNEEEAQEKLRTIKKSHYDANHNVWAYVIGEDMEIQRYSDDGEPSGTAGMPTLDVIRKNGLTDVLIVVTRYFGGIKLGTGGLVRAYSKSARSAIVEAVFIERKLFKLVEFEVDYGFLGRLQQEIKDSQLLLKETVYEDTVKFFVYIEPEYVEIAKSQFVDWTNGNCMMEEQGEQWLTLEVEESSYD